MAIKKFENFSIYETDYMICLIKHKHTWWKRFLNKNKCSILFVIVISVIAGCVTQGTSTQSSTSTLEDSSTDSFEVSNVTATFSGSPTATQESTSTITTVITSTIGPTYPPDQAESLVEELLKTNAGCKLPCWWGFTPGITEWQEARGFLARIARGINELLPPEGTYQVVDVILPLPDEISHYGLLHIYRIRDGVIDMIEVNPGQFEIYSVSSILTTYGVPSEVRIWTFREAFRDFFTFDLFLFYPDQGIVVRYSTDAKKDENLVQGCFNNARTLSIALWSPDIKLSFQDVSKQTRNIDISDWGIPVEIEEATELTIEKFYNLFSNSSNELCIDTPDDIWSMP